MKLPLQHKIRQQLIFTNNPIFMRKNHLQTRYNFQ